MLSDSELLTLLNDLESDRAERKASLTDKDKVCQAICAFANDLPDHRKEGVLFIGANDDGSCAGAAITDELLLELAAIRSDGNIVPFPSLTVQKRVLGGCELAVALVEPSDAPPVRYRGRVWVRVGPRRAVATAEEERRLSEKRRARDLPFDLRPLPSASVGDLDLEVFRTYLKSALAPDVLERNERTVEEQLTATRMLTPGSESVPTVLGVLTIGKDPPSYVPGAYIQFIRFGGVDLTSPIQDAAELSGPLPEMLRMLDEKLLSHISVASDITSSAVEIRTPDYPIAALRQLAYNAVLHRNYDGTAAPVRISWFHDRIEILNPGGPYGQVTRSNFGRPGITDYRNPHLAEAMRCLGYVQRFGVGIAIARSELARNGNPELEFTVEDSNILATVRRRR